jgi:Tol biopolymer transport system component
LFYSDYTAIYSYDFQRQENKVIFKGNPKEIAIGNRSIYFRGATEPPTKIDLYKINFDGSNLKQLTTNGSMASIVLDPTNRYMAYTQLDQEQHSSISLLDLENDSVQIVAKENGDCPSWSPDGKELLYFDWQLTDYRLHRYSLRNKDVDELLSNVFNCSLSWLPDGKSVSLAIQENQSWGVYIFDLEERTLKSLLVDGQLLQGTNLVWSSQGDKFAYETYEYGIGYQLILFDIITGARTIIEEKGVDDWSYHPTWSPDGNYLAYFTISSLNTYPPMLDIYKVSSGEHSEIEILGNWIISPVWIDR